MRPLRNIAILIIPQLFLLAALWLSTGTMAAAVVAAWVAFSLFVVFSLLWPRGGMFGVTLWRCPPQPRVALTFDDGPHPEDTPAILDILRRTNTRATFFFVGSRARRHPDLVRRVAREGHEVGAHSDTHPWWFSVTWKGRIHREVRDSVVTLEGLAGRRPRHFRPPMGHQNVFLSDALADAGLVLTTWSARAYDTMRRKPERIAATVLDRARPGGIILLHEGVRRDPGQRSATVEALPSIIEGLAARGLAPVSLEDLEGTPPRPNASAGSARAAGEP